ncbi:Integrator complex subunit 5 [Nymphon striatum]|nr:Integrator complex subunit 5 [Nymphon striatum]
MAEDIPSTPSSPDGGATTNELLHEVRLFISGATNTNVSFEVSSHDLVKSSIFLLKSLPAAREAVLEHLYSVFDEFVGQHIMNLESNSEKATISGPGNSNTYLIEEINSILTNFILSNPDSWSPIIFNWSLDLLGRLSSKYGVKLGFQALNPSESLKNVLDIWMKCQATKILIHLSSQCLSTLMNSNVDICIDALLNMSVQHSPYFDWFIAHIGSCFPNTIITRVLACGLKDFYYIAVQQERPERNIPKIASVVEILGHLSGKHSGQIKEALFSLAKSGIIIQDPTHLQLTTIPFLIQLASMSPMLCTLMSDVMDLCCIMFVVKFLTMLLVEIQFLIYSNVADIPVFHSLAADQSFITKHLIEPNSSMKSKWICRLIAYFCVHSDKNTSVSVVTLILQKCSSMSILLNLLKYLEQSSDILNISVQQAICSINKKNRFQLLNNLKVLIKNKVEHPRVMNAVVPNLNFICDQLNDDDASVSIAALELLILIPFSGNSDIAILSKLCNEIVLLMFHVMTAEVKNKFQSEYVVQLCGKLLVSFVHNSNMLYLILRLLVKGTFSDTNKKWFGNKSIKLQSRGEVPFSILEENKKHYKNIPLPQSHSTVFFSGIIGNGKRVVKDEVKPDDMTILQNKQHILRVIRNCCISSKYKRETPNIDSMSKLSLLLVELISPDVMFNGLPWPDEEFLKVTIERDIFICKLLENNPTLWDILFLVARTKPALCYCSVILRGVAAILLSFWSTSQEKKVINCPKKLETTKNLISLMSLGELIPPPLSLVGEILNELSPYETYIVLKDIWRYMIDNVPSPDTFVKSESGDMVRNIMLRRAAERYTIRLRHIVQTKIDKLGSTDVPFPYEIEEILFEADDDIVCGEVEESEEESNAED